MLRKIFRTIFSLFLKGKGKPSNTKYHKVAEHRRLEKNRLVVPKRDLTEEEIENKLNVAKGLYKFYFGDNYVWARDKKNARRKALNKGYLQS